MNSDYMKTRVMEKFHRQNGFLYMATEVVIPYHVSFRWGYDVTSQADIAMINRAETRIYEVEVKTNRSDLKNEFIAKKRKHESYQSKDGYGPHYYLLTFPEGMGLENEEIIPDNYGILLVNDKEYWWLNCKYVKKAKMLPCKKLDIEKQFKIIARRATSELMWLRKKKLKKG